MRRMGGWADRRMVRRILTIGFFLSGYPAIRLSAQCPDGSPPPCRGARVAAAPITNSVAVLYFDNASSDTSDAYLADGITEEIISRLGQVGARVQVKSRYAVRRYRGAAADNPQTIGRQLAVSSIVTGSVRRAGNRLRVTAEMVRTSTGDVMWSERYDRAETDVLSLQEDLASAVATAITGRLLPAELRALAVQPTRNPAAWDHFVRGNASLAQRTSAAYSRALTEFETAARLDPAFSRALARIAYVYGVATWRGEPVNGLLPDSSWRLARAAAGRAVRANPSLSDTWLALGMVQMQRPESAAVARVSLERAIALDSGNAEAWHVYGWVLFYVGRGPESGAAWHRALAIEPGRPVTLVMLGTHHLFSRRWTEGLRWLDSALALDHGFDQARRVRIIARLGSGDTAGARDDVARMAGSMGTALMGSGGAVPGNARTGLELIAVQAGDSAPLRAEIARQMALPPDSLEDAQLVMIAAGLVVLGEADRALGMLERTRWKNVNFYINCLLWPFDGLRGLPRYERLLDEWRIPAGAR